MAEQNHIEAHQEIQPGFTPQYIIFTIMIALITGIIGYGFNYLLNKSIKDRKSIQFSVKSSDNFLSLKETLPFAHF